MDTNPATQSGRGEEIAMNVFQFKLPTACEYRTARRAFENLRKVAAVKPAGNR